MKEPIHINRSAKWFSLRDLQEWLTAVRDSQYDLNWLEALRDFWDDEDMVLILSGQPLEDALTKAGTRVGSNPAQAAALAVRRYLTHLSSLGHPAHTNVPHIKTQLDGDSIWVWHRGTYHTDPLRKSVRKSDSEWLTG